MRLHPRNLLLLVVLFGLTGWNVVLERGGPVARESGPLLSDFDPARVARVLLTPAEGEPLELVRAGEGDGWVLPASGGFPVFAYAVGDLLNRIGQLSRADLVGQEPGSFGAHGVGTAGLRIALQDASGSALAELIQGAPPGLAAGSNVRLADGDAVYRASGLRPVSTAPAAWLDTRLIDFDPTRVRGVAIHHEGGRIFLDLLREQDSWRLLNETGKRAPKNLVERVLQVTSTLVFADLTDARIEPKNGFGSPPQTLIEVELADDERASVWIGLPTGEGAYLATNPAWPKAWCVELPSRTAEVLFSAIETLDGAVR